MSSAWFENQLRCSQEEGALGSLASQPWELGRWPWRAPGKEEQAAPLGIQAVAALREELASRGGRLDSRQVAVSPRDGASMHPLGLIFGKFIFTSILY